MRIAETTESQNRKPPTGQPPPLTRGQFGTYAASDHLKVAVENGAVKYYRNGTLLYTSTVAPQYPLLVDTSLNTVNAGVYNVVLASNVQNVTWTNVSSTIQVTGNSIQKTSGTSSWYDAGAVSTQTIASGNGYVDFVPGETGTWRMCGLGNGDTSADYADIEYAFFMVGDATLHIYESGNYRGQFGTYAASDHLKVAVENGVVKYYRNATLLYTSTVAPQYPLLVDTSLNTVWSGVYNVTITSTTPSASGNLNWLVADQLGTPRMIFDKTGSLATTKRHDYLPFGEELFATTGARSTAQGYSVADGVRQKFTSKERDSETGLDFFKSRYYSASQGRFTSADSFAGSPINPQSLNRYAYGLGNPIRYKDPSGHLAVGGSIRDLNDWFHWLKNEGALESTKPSMPLRLCGSGCGGGQNQGQTQDPSKPYLPTAVAPAGVPDIPEGTVGIPEVTGFYPQPPHRSFWQKVKAIFGFGSTAAAAGSSTWGRPETLQDHFERHGGEFGARTSEEYAQQAQELLVKAAQGGAKMKIGTDGVIRVYEPETNTFGAFNMNGTTRTMFKPTLDEFYFTRQPGRPPWYPRTAEPEVEPEVEPDIEPEIPIEIPPL